MKSSSRYFVLAGLTLCSFLITAPNTNAQSQVAVTPNAPWQGFMNVFNLPSAGGGYQFGSAWGVADLTATWAGQVLTLGPNTIGDTNSYWYTPAGGPGATGNKIMDANIYVETTGVYSGQTLTFSGNVLANTLAGKQDPNGNGWTSVAFIKDFAPDYSSSVSITAPLVNGAFSISLAALADPTRHIQYGFETIGPDVWITDVAPYGSIQIVPEPSSLALLGLGLAGTLVWRRRQ
jgi:PEP-CTERM motif